MAIRRVTRDPRTCGQSSGTDVRLSPGETLVIKALGESGARRLMAGPSSTLLGCARTDRTAAVSSRARESFPRVRPLGGAMVGAGITARAAGSKGLNDALRKDQRLGVFGRPLVFLDRGFGASIIRQGVPLPAGGRNTMPLIQIPYSKLATKHNLTSIVHEGWAPGAGRIGTHGASGRGCAGRVVRHGSAAGDQPSFCPLDKLNVLEGLIQLSLVDAGDLLDFGGIGQRSPADPFP